MSTPEHNSEAGKGGLLDSVKNLLATLLAMGQTRLELLSTELEEERGRLTSMLMWTLIAFFCAALVVVLFTLLMVVIFWDSNRLLAICIMMGIFVVGTGTAWRIAYNISRSRPRLFSATTTELAKDCEQLSASHEE